MTSVRVILLRRCVALNISVHGLQGHINGTSVDGDDSDVEGVGGPNGGGGYHRDDEDDRHRSLAVTEIGVIPPPPMFRYSLVPIRRHVPINSHSSRHGT